MINKKDFFAYMSELYDEEYNDIDSYKVLKSIIKTKDSNRIEELKNLVLMDHKERLLYRHSLASNGKEFTPKQVDQYISIVEYALSNLE